MRARGRILAATALAFAFASVLSAPALGEEPRRDIPLAELKSGAEFMAKETRAQQDDLGVNPGMLWVERGDALWRTAIGTEGKSCASCHGTPDRLAGAATRYPKLDPASGRIVNLEGRIQQCRAGRQRAAALAYESEDLLALTALVAHQSRGQPLAVSIEGPARQAFELGQRLYGERQGQLNLACSQCHVDNRGKKLRAESISQGHPNGYPAYRLEWQGVGSLHRRLRACFLGVRAEPFASGSDEMIALELYLAWRAQGLANETPAVRR